VPDPVVPGRVLGGRYRLDHELARGGMASVWVAEDSLLARRVAIKVLHPELAVDDALRTRFRREAISAAKLTHPNIVTTYDTGDDNGTAYIVMELVDGTTLRRMLDEQTRLPVDETVSIAVQVADALEHAHRQGLVHRDIKPANVLVTHSGYVKVTDFGIAKLAGSSDLTRTGTVIGTARYLAPEQVNGATSDARTDVYALGLVVYEMLCGQLPFAGETDVATAVARLTTTPAPVHEHCREASPALDAAIARSLALEPRDRFASAHAFRDALDPAKSHADDTDRTLLVEPVAGDATIGIDRPPAPPSAPPAAPARPPAPRARRRRWWVALLAILLFAVGAGVGYLALNSGGSGNTNRTTPAAAGGPIKLVSAKDFDPQGDNRSENPGQVRFAFDGDPTTAWSTEHYNTVDFGRAKAGAGIWFDLGSSHTVRSVEVDSPDTGWSAAVYVADNPAATLAGWGKPRATGSDLGTHARLTLSSPASGRYVLLWITRLPASGKLRVSEVRVNG
jgi:tRNA A-37 threonylcarbamoyl transferase component Bud32